MRGPDGGSASGTSNLPLPTDYSLLYLLVNATFDAFMICTIELNDTVVLSEDRLLVR